VETDVVTCPVCTMRVLPTADGTCPSCHAYDFATAQVVDEDAARKTRARVVAARKPDRRLHPLSVVSALLGLGSLAAGPYPGIGAGLLAALAGWWSSRDIRRSAGRESGLWLARSGLVLGLAMAGVWISILLVGWHVSH
jgi:hypothetical protein